jgi:hypothetical protein
VRYHICWGSWHGRDVDILVFDMGKEQTEKQWRELYEAAGLTITSITPLRSAPASWKADELTHNHWDNSSARIFAGQMRVVSSRAA